MTLSKPDFAVVGHPIAHSRSPMVHEAFAKSCEINLTYERIDADPQQFETVVEDFFARGGRGLNITVPFKERAFEMAREHLSPRALDAGAVNTLWMADGKLHGCNTDGPGLIADLERQDMLNNKRRILVLGAGGAARGVIGPLLQTGCDTLFVANRTAARAQTLVTQWVQNHPEDTGRLHGGGLDDPALHEPWDLIINATSSSLGTQSLTLPAGAIASGSDVYDMMYAAQPTPFLIACLDAGARKASDGLGMLVCQAAESFAIWHGKQPEVAEVVDAVRQDLQRETP